MAIEIDWQMAHVDGHQTITRQDSREAQLRTDSDAENPRIYGIALLLS